LFSFLKFFLLAELRQIQFAIFYPKFEIKIRSAIFHLNSTKIFPVTAKIGLTVPTYPKFADVNICQ